MQTDYTLSVELAIQHAFHQWFAIGSHAPIETQLHNRIVSEPDSEPVLKLWFPNQGMLALGNASALALGVAAYTESAYDASGPFGNVPGVQELVTRQSRDDQDVATFVYRQPGRILMVFIATGLRGAARLIEDALQGHLTTRALASEWQTRVFLIVETEPE